MNGVKETLEYIPRYGIATVLVVVLTLFFLGTFIKILSWVFKRAEVLSQMSHDREMELAKVINSGMKSMSDALIQNSMICQEIARNLKDGFDRMNHEIEKRDCKAK